MCPVVIAPEGRHWLRHASLVAVMRVYQEGALLAHLLALTRLLQHAACSEQTAWSKFGQGREKMDGSATTYGEKTEVNYTTWGSFDKTGPTVFHGIS